MAGAAAEADAFLASMQAEVDAEAQYPQPPAAANDLVAQAQAAAASLNAQLAAQQAVPHANGHASEDNRGWFPPGADALPGPPAPGAYTAAPAAGAYDAALPPPPQPASAVDQEESGAAEGRRKRRNRWGNPSGTEGAVSEAAQDSAPAPDGATEGAPVRRKRKSRWEEEDTSTDLALNNNVPKQIVLAGGITVCCDHTFTCAEAQDLVVLQ